MISTVELLDAARRHQGDVTDYRIAKILGVPQATVSNYRTGRTKPINSIAMRLAELAGFDPVEAMVAVNLERADTPEDREAWEMVMARVSAPKSRKTGH
ncbi:MAG TPA: hypothetical protein VGE36_14295 [Roseateles sp.]